MGIIFFMLAIIIIAAFIGIIIMNYIDISPNTLFPFIFIIIFTAVTIGILTCIPTALDVYQGKTTLEITYKDGVAIDSTVVFKDKEK